jgi:hypothetical protein
LTKEGPRGSRRHRAGRHLAERLARLLDLERSLKGLRPGDERSRLVAERFAVFDDEEIWAIVRECEPYL